METRNIVFSKLGFILASVLLAAPVLFYSSGVKADPFDAFDAIPAANCMPKNTESLNNIELVGGVWQFKGNRTGTAILECPVETLGTTGPDFARGFLVYYQDTDGGITDTNISFSLVKRLSGIFTSVGTFDTSYDSAPTLPALKFTFTNADIGVELWYMRVEMTRSSHYEQTTMAGILIIE